MAKPSRRFRRHLLGFTVLFLSSAMILGLNSERFAKTEASWTDNSYASASFSTVSIGSLGVITCDDSRSILGTGLLSEGQVRLTWNRPPNLEGVPLEYVVTWKESGLFTSSGTKTTSDTSFIYTASGLSVVSLGVTFTVTAKVKNSTWTGTASTAAATSVGIIIVNVYMKCR